MISAPYLDRRDGIPTWDFDQDDAVNLKIDLTARGYLSPITVTPLTPVIEQAGCTVTISNVSVTGNFLTFKVAGAGGTVTFRVASGTTAPESEDITVRFKKVA